MNPFAATLGATIVPILAVTAVVAGGSWLIARVARGREAARLAGVRGMLASLVFALLWWTLALDNPSASGSDRINLEPFREITRSLESGSVGYTALNLVGNVLVFVPVGMLLVLAFGPRRRCAGILAFLLGTSLSVGIEVAQVAIGRAADIDDVILNSAGVLVGVVSARVGQLGNRLRERWAMAKSQRRKS